VGGWIISSGYNERVLCTSTHDKAASHLHPEHRAGHPKLASGVGDR